LTRRVAAADPGERNNLEARHRDRVRAMVGLLKEIVAAGRSTPGPRQANDVPVDVWKLATMPGVRPEALDDY
jgi:hypothetical protein